MPVSHDLALRRAEYDAGLKRRKSDLSHALAEWSGKEADEYEESEKVVKLVIDAFNATTSLNRLTLRKHGPDVFKCLTLVDLLKKVRAYDCTCECDECQDAAHSDCTGDDYGDRCYRDAGVSPLPGGYRAKTPHDLGGPTCDPYHKPAVTYWRGYWVQDRDLLINSITAFKEPRP
ncbi:hypothetical protein SEA_WHEELBITE_91 [Arthrobacter phage Wheelbite]|uniref:Uncharacterized protein n=1 Tax=Arthrobacter phage Wheelbite TaxID=2015873 RepID=A0A222ZHI1_9CAUD|nr:hypothetical protein KMD23_gp91 [Arthrobacter phage Wheelbite]ASR84177.1 hypothetical protein SEA_WHEELBITE_91 [Arthrobacter phage Wheelbite]